jgi:uncharacterized protein Veg
MLSNIKETVENLKGKKIKILVDVGRNKNEVYEGYIKDTYKNIWTFKTDVDLKSYGYYEK